MRVWCAAFFLAATLCISSSADAVQLVSHRIMVMTLRVHNCEEPVWNVNGPKYYGGLGWLDATWLAFKRKDFPRYMSEATPQEQAYAMEQFAKKYGWPDQHGCSGGY